MASRAALTDVFDEETDGLGAKVGQSIGAQLVGTIKKVLAAAGIGKIIKDSLDMGGALQQSIGGIETLFGAGGKEHGRICPVRGQIGGCR